MAAGISSGCPLSARRFWLTHPARSAPPTAPPRKSACRAGGSGYTGCTGFVSFAACTFPPTKIRSGWFRRQPCAFCGEAGTLGRRAAAGRYHCHNACPRRQPRIAHPPTTPSIAACRFLQTHRRRSPRLQSWQLATLRKRGIEAGRWNAPDAEPPPAPPPAHLSHCHRPPRRRRRRAIPQTKVPDGSAPSLTTELTMPPPPPRIARK